MLLIQIARRQFDKQEVLLGGRVRPLVDQHLVGLQVLLLCFASCLLLYKVLQKLTSPFPSPS